MTRAAVSGGAAVLLAVLAAPSVAAAHPLSLGVLSVTDRGDGEVAATLAFSGSEARPGGARVVLPPWCERAAAHEVALPTGVERSFAARCGSRGLTGGRVGVRNIGDAQVLLRLTTPRGTRRVTLDATRSSLLVEGAAPTDRVLRDYGRLGVRHVLEGLDHLLFVLGLLLLARRPRAVIAAVTAFTVAHSLTLAAAVLGWLTVPSAPVEAVIAASVLLLAVELARPRDAAPTWTGRAPWAAAALFGLLHGLGFAGALEEAGLPQGEIPAALFAFNVGVELGQLVFVGACAGLVRLWPTRWPSMRRPVVYGMGGAASFWLFERLAAL